MIVHDYQMYLMFENTAVNNEGNALQNDTNPIYDAMDD